MTENSAIALSGEWRAHAADPDLVKTFAALDTPDGGWPNVHVPHHWNDGSMLYRRRFTCAPPDGLRAFLEIDDRSDAWLDGEYLGATEGTFVPGAFEITDTLRARDEHLLAIEAPGLPHAPRIVTTGAVKLADARVLCVEASVEHGRLACHLALDAGATPREARLHAIVRGPNAGLLLETSRDATLAAGTNELWWPLTVEDPPRWWPHGFGPQMRCTLDLTVEVDGHPSDARQFRVGFREIRADGMRFSVNGARMFLKGACDDDVARAVASNLDFLRVRDHVADDSVYDAADDAGLLLLQDFPVSGRGASRRVGPLVSRLGHHPSVFAWRAHRRSVARALRRCDPTRAVLTQDTDLQVSDVARAVRLVPRVGRFVSALSPSQLAIEDLRRCAGAPTGGFAVTGEPDDVVRDACRPLLPMVDPRTGNVHVANDTPRALHDATIEVSAGGRTRRWRGDLDAGAVAFVGRVDVDGASRIEARLSHPEVGRIVNVIRGPRSGAA